MAVQHQQGKLPGTRKSKPNGVTLTGKEVRNSRSLRMRMAPEKEFRGLVRIVATLQALCLLAIFGVADVFAQSTNANRLVSFSLQVEGSGTVISKPPLSCTADGSCTGEFRRGTIIRLTANPGEGQILSRWQGACKGSQTNCRIRLRGSKRVVANFGPPPLIPIRVFLRGAGTIESSPTLNCTETECQGEFPRGTVVHLTAKPAEGQILRRWRGACDGSREQCRVRLRRGPKRVLAVFRTPPLIPLRVFLQGEGRVVSDPIGLECSNQVCRGRFAQGTHVTLHAEPSENNSFNRWRGACRGQEECVVTMRRPRNVLANFTANPPTNVPILTVKIEGNGSLSVASSSSGSVSEEVCSSPGCEMKFPPNTSVTLTPKLVDGQEFSWGGACEGQGSEACSVTLTTSLEVAAAFGPPPPPPDVTLMLNLVGAGSVVSDPPGIDCTAGAGTCSGKFKPETTVSLTATPGVGHEFGGWSDPICQKNLVCSLKVTEPVEEIIATFVMVTASLSIEVIGEGSVTSDPEGILCPPSETCAAGYPFGQTVTLMATPKDGHIWQSWSHENCSVAEKCEVKLGQPTTKVTAVFQPAPVALNVVLAGNGTGTVTSNVGGIDCPSTCTATFDSGSEVILTAIPTPDTGHTFEGWSGGSCSGTGLCVVTLGAGTTVTATFLAPPSGGVTRSEAIRFLEQSTWGPTEALIARVMDVNVGKSGFLAEQLAEPFQGNPSVYPAPNPDSNSLSPLHDQWFFNAFHAEDQLRQRVAFALSQLFVVSANTVGRDEQMIPYQQMLHVHAFGNFRDLMERVTLSPTMGRFLDMVNNDKTEPGSGLNPNENYAREILQLFTVGTTLLNIDGSNVLDVDGQPIPPYDEEVIINLARVFTGWTYPTDRSEDPNAQPRWRNPEFYNGPMEPVESHHDTGPKTLMNGVTLAGGSANVDLRDALDHIFTHPNVGPFVATRLIRNLVTSNPSPGYIQRVAEAFNNSNGVRGDMKAVITAILTDSEAETVVVPHGGHLREPILYAIAVLRALNATVDLDNDLYNRTRDMGQALFSPPSVFNYFSPLYIIPSTSPPLFGPEYQIHNLSSAITRVNFVDRVVNNQVGGVSVDWSAFEVVAGNGNEDQLIDAVALRLLHEPLTQEERNAIRTALVNTDGTNAKVRAAVYLIATSGKYQVQH